MDGLKRQKRALALLAIGGVLGAALITPAGAHIGSVSHSWKKHFLPLAKKSFFTKKQTFSKTQANARFDTRNAQIGKTETGAYSFVASDGGGFTGAHIDFDQMLPAALPAGNAHYVTAPTTECPGAGQAAPGHLCVYPTFLGSATFYDFFSPTDASSGEDTSRQGSMMVFSITGGAPNGRGVWAVTPAAASTLSDADSSPARPAFSD